MLCDQYYLTSPELKLTEVNGKMTAFMSVFLVAKLLLLLNQKASISIGTYQFICLGPGPLCFIGTSFNLLS